MNDVSIALKGIAIIVSILLLMIFVCMPFAVKECFQEISIKSKIERMLLKFVIVIISICVTIGVFIIVYMFVETMWSYGGI